jgi:hypothetical protein
MDTLFGTAPALARNTMPEPLPVDQRKKPGLALLLSLLIPGAGHMYSGLVRNGIFTLLLFAGALLVSISTNPSTSPIAWGIAVRTALVLYIFGFVDAFQVAREHNAGLESYLVGTNPRIAGVLNLLTKGWGYFYLGKRKLGIGVFFLLTLLNAAAIGQQDHDVFVFIAALSEVVLLALAIHGYLIAQRQRAELFPAEGLEKFSRESEGLHPIVPTLLASLLALNYFVIVAAGLALPNYKNLDQGAAKIDNSDTGAKYSNGRYGVNLTAPAGWTISTNRPTLLAVASRFAGGCSVSVMPVANLPVHTYAGEARALMKGLAKSHFYELREGPDTLAGRNAYFLLVATKSHGVDVQVRYTFQQRGLTMWALIETANSRLYDECESDMKSIHAKFAVN